MSPKTLFVASAISGDSLLAHLVEEITAKLQAGEIVELTTYQQRHPECADKPAWMIL